MEQPIPSDSELPEIQVNSEPPQDDPNPAEALEGDVPSEEEEEIEIGEHRFALPKSAAEKLKAERMMQADYTRKTQEVAEHRKAVEAERAQFSQEKETHQQYIKDMAKVEALNDQLAMYEKVDWQKLIAEHPQDAMLYQQQQRTIESERNKAVQSLTQKQQQFALDEQQSFAKRIQDAEAYVQREIPGWTQDRSEKLTSYAAAEGIKVDQAFARTLINQPALLKIMHKAEMYDQLAKKQSAKPAPAAPPAPATRVSAARPGAQRDPAKMSTAEWMAHRNSQTRKP